MHKKPIGNPLRPINTLGAPRRVAASTQGEHLIQYGSKSKRVLHPSRDRRSHPLSEIHLSHEDDVPQSTSKRRKLLASFSPPAKDQIEISDDDASERASKISPRVPLQPRSAHPEGRQLSLTPPGSDRLRGNPRAHPSSAVQEYSNVERAHGFSRRRKPRQNSYARPRKTPSPSPSAIMGPQDTNKHGSTSRLAIEVDDDISQKSSQQDAHGTTLGRNNQISNGNGTESPYFKNRRTSVSPPAQSFEAIPLREKKRKYQQRWDEPRSITLNREQDRSSFTRASHQITPEPQISTPGTSPDELEGESTPRARKRTATLSVHRQETQKLRPEKSETAKSRALPHSSGDIKSIEYNRSGRNLRDALPGRSKPFGLQERHKKYLVLEIKIGASYRKLNNTILTFDGASNNFHFDQHSSSEHNELSEIFVKPDKILTIWFQEDFLQIHSCREEENPDTKMLIRLESAKAAESLTKELTECSAGIKVKPMENGNFKDNIRKEPTSAQQLAKTKVGSPDEDVQRIQNNNERRKRAPEARRVNGDNPIIKARLLANTERDQQPGHSGPPTSKPVHDPFEHEILYEDAGKGAERPKSTRSTRAKAGDEPFSTHPRRPTRRAETMREELPRYSVDTGLGAPWIVPLVYPPSGQRRATVDFFDLVRLDEGEFLNDNIISFYLRYLEQALQESSPDVAKRVYMFNTFFYERLTDTPRGKKGTINYEAVQKWTSKVDIFNFDFVVVPINERDSKDEQFVDVTPQPERNVSNEKVEPEEKAVDGDVRQTLPSNSGHDYKPDVEEAEGGMARMSLSKTDPKQGRLLSTSSGSHWPGSFDQGEEDGSEEPVQRALSPEDPPSQITPAQRSDSQPRTPGPNSDEIEVQRQMSDSSKQSPNVNKKSKRKSLPPPARKYKTDVPIIITLDSLGLSHSPTVRSLKDYLSLEAKTKRGIDVEISQISGMTAKQIPEQDNFCDCGLFLLGYVERFLQSPRLLVNKLLQRESDRTKDWPKLQPSPMRNSLRELIMRLGKSQNEIALAKKREKKPATKKRGKDQNDNIEPDASKEPSPSTLQSPNQIESIRSKEDVKDAIRPVELGVSQSSSVLEVNPDPVYQNVESHGQIVAEEHADDRGEGVVPQSVERPEERTREDESPLQSPKRQKRSEQVNRNRHDYPPFRFPQEQRLEKGETGDESPQSLSGHDEDPIVVRDSPEPSTSDAQPHVSRARDEDLPRHRARLRDSNASVDVLTGV
ncbi:MAG: hypothetical protein M4579_001632 [Chaenotheca gracillima]|nr:MAG: hypothetical protein M4579_001632 [Chaenotheca gracillima]